MERIPWRRAPLPGSHAGGAKPPYSDGTQVRAPGLPEDCIDVDLNASEQLHVYFTTGIEILEFEHHEIPSPSR